jgi:hypothetical protein
MAARHQTNCVRRLSLAALCAVLWQLAPVAASAGDLAEEIPVASGGTLKVELDRGSVEIRSRDAAAIRIRAGARGLGASSVHFSVDARGGDVTLTGSHDAWVDWMTVGPTVSVRAWVPRDCSVEVRTSGGGIEIGDIGGGVVARTSGGSIRVERVEGRAELTTSDGAIVSEAVHGAVSAATSGGRITLDGVAGDVRATAREGRIHLSEVGGDVDARAVGGAIEIDGVSGAVHAETDGGSVWTRFLRVPSGRVEARGGAIEVAFPASAGAQLDAAAEGGRVYVEHGLRSLSAANSGRVVGAVNGGGPTLQLRATGGDIHVRRP